MQLKLLWPTQTQTVCAKMATDVLLLPPLMLLLSTAAAVDDAAAADIFFSVEDVSASVGSPRNIKSQPHSWLLLSAVNDCCWIGVTCEV